ncbi:hypothetical protein DUI87_08951 [Hirundo rustica rustica]|uniref:Uncharacterized protein n=1 Tax=Hirundo rustica rustica TaxID=333673 RepID=A0A3M0KKT7_HIRRU|nr:hypothetical protein DUI87_08951 [Hirundo rustica rustica]
MGTGEERLVSSWWLEALGKNSSKDVREVLLVFRDLRLFIIGNGRNPSEEPRQYGEMGREEPSEVQPGHMEGPSLGRNNPLHWHRLGTNLLESSSGDNGPAMCPCGQEEGLQDNQVMGIIMLGITSMIDLTLLDFNIFGIISLTCFDKGQSKIHYDLLPVSSLGQNKRSETAVDTK